MYLKKEVRVLNPWEVKQSTGTKHYEPQRAHDHELSVNKEVRISTPQTPIDCAHNNHYVSKEAERLFLTEYTINISFQTGARKDYLFLNAHPRGIKMFWKRESLN